MSKVRGPPSNTWYGPALEFMQGEVGEADFPWLDEYGAVVRLSAPLVPGGDILLISDSKALRHMHQTAFNEFGANALRHAIVNLMTGPGIATAQGLDHVRQHQVIQPGFGISEIRTHIPHFFEYADKLSDRWSEILGASNGSAVIDVTEWNSKLTLDLVGRALFDYEFGALDGKEDDLIHACENAENVIVESMGTMVEGGVIFMALSKYISPTIYNFVLDHSWDPKITRIRHARDLCRSFAERIVAEKKAAILDGRQDKDIMSLIVRANSSNKDVKNRMNDEELLAQDLSVRWEQYGDPHHALDTHGTCPESGIAATTERRNTGQKPYGMESADLDSLTFMNAFLKETLRMHPVTFMVTQEPKADTVLPLSQPLTLSTEEVITELSIPKGQNIVSSLSGYNRLKELWGQDAHVFNPDRWLGDSLKGKSTGFGMYNWFFLWTRCWWKFALVLLQVYIVRVAGHFRFSMTEDSKKIKRQSSVYMMPKVDGSPERGITLPLSVELDDE
ncbi:cytochrome P450 [Hymenopellis radicata]|nr:cytochrome P450 [Hymenopellis radicata]